MTLTELRYVVALAQERHFGHAAAKCFVSQPTLSTAVLKLEAELGTVLFERRKHEVLITPKGERIVEQALRVLEEAALIKGIANQSKDELTGALRVGVIPTVGPYLVPDLIPVLRRRAPAMPLEIEENLTANLNELLRNGKLDVIVIALPFAAPGIVTRPLYDEPFAVVVPLGHRWQHKSKLKAHDLPSENVLMLHAGHCFRGQVVEACPELSRADSGGLQGGSLETIRQMVASGLGVSVLPARALTPKHQNKLLRVVPFDNPAPSRRIALAWRKSFPRPAAIEALRQAIQSVNAKGIGVVEKSQLEDLR
jgi:LysR family transcriptional regulator, hydrogen peroxide-inducible genes activator